MSIKIFLILITFFNISSLSFAQDQIPNCLTNSGELLNINNDQVLKWKETSQDQFHSRGHIFGSLVNIFPDATGHHHMSVLIGPNNQDTIEVIYNEDFGPMPALKIGDKIEACGDYITSRGTVGSYPASPDGAIVHWVHRSPNPNHMSGFVVVDGTLCGQDKEHGGPKH
jgi:hypothetical protein